MFKDKWDLYDVKVVELNKIPLEFSKMSLNFDLSIEKIEQILDQMIQLIFGI